MRKKISAIILAILAMLLATSCQVIEQAVEDTFRPLPQKHEAPDDSDQSFLEKVEGFLVGDLFIETGINLTTFDIEDDVFASWTLKTRFWTLSSLSGSTSERMRSTIT